MVRDGEAEGAGSVQAEEEKRKLRSHHDLQWADWKRWHLPEVHGERSESTSGNRGNPH